MDTPLLDTIQSPVDLKKFDYRQMEQLCAEIRAFLIEHVSKTGGHLSSNLGVIELTVALHRVLNSPLDTIVFDVGHQCYTHKLLTGRKAGFTALRQAGGLSGFPNPAESPHDSFIAGHGSTSISVATGLARAKKLKGEPGLVVVVIGDGAFTGGMTYEAINNVNGLDNLVVILNDNKMSISKNVGALAGYLSQLRSNPGYYKAKSDVKDVLDKTPLVGQGLKRGIQTVKASLRRGIYHSTFFEDLGFQYIGPVDGHNLPDLCGLIYNAKNNIEKPLFIHLDTTKGKGFEPAELNPSAFHGVPAFDAKNIPDPDFSPGNSFSNVFGKQLAELGQQNKQLCAITAAMKYGTGLQYFKKQHPQRFFDVGMAEEHAVTFAAGLAKGGFTPVVGIYSTFLQRAYDQIIHDVMLQNLNVLFAIDRAGLVPGDGDTHQGIYDAAFLSQQHSMPIVSPANYAELTYWLPKLLQGYTTPRAIRYPRGTEYEPMASFACMGKVYNKLVANNKPAAALVSYGSETGDAIMAARQLAQQGTQADVYQMVFINPIAPALVQELLDYPVVLFAEEGIKQGGIGEHLALQLYTAGFKGEFVHLGVPEKGNDHASVPEMKAEIGLDAAGLARKLLEAL
ncbi:1-deoxy-D-xylulose-5-phosphate synthase [Ruminococcaceae bacterium OttesenSCG-928-A16]|nr:1-deoxy-D-xylulose-5-phosphate synthase [Ruminococcaceae bacterium OttesenSCG-928-A16]